MFSLEKAYLNRAFQGIYTIPCIDTEDEWRSFKLVAVKIYNFMRGKVKENIEIPQYISSCEKKRNGYEMGVVYDYEKMYFCAHLAHPDIEVAARQWILEAELKFDEDRNTLVFATHVSYTTLSNNFQGQDKIFSIPGYVNTIFKNFVLEDCRPLKSKCWHIHYDDEIEELFDLINNTNRVFPVIVVTQHRSEGIGASYMNDYPVDLDWLSRNTKQYCHIVALDEEFEKKWCEKVGAEWGVYNGAIRTYYPNIDFTNDDSYKHPVATYITIMKSYSEDENGNSCQMGEAFSKELIGWLRRHNTSRYFEWRDLGYRFYAQASRDLLIERMKDLSSEDIISAQDSQIKSLEEESKKKDETIRLYESNLNEAMDINNKMSADIYYLQCRVDDLKKALKDVGSDAGETPMPNTYEEVTEWAEKYYSNTLLILGRAAGALRKSNFEDKGLVFGVLKMLGEEYYRMRMKTGTKEEFDRRCEELGVEDTPSVSKVQAGMHGKQYYIKHNGRERLLDKHIKSNSSRDSRYILRVYYFWDEDYKQVVVGYMPDHLDNSRT